MEDEPMSNERLKFDFDESFDVCAKIKVVGVGGAGGNAINRMIESGLSGVDFIALNTDAQVLETNRAEKKIQIGKRLTKGLGAGANPDIGKRAAEEDQEEIKEALAGADMVFVAAGMGGGTGTGASPIVAELARQHGALTVAIVTRPFMCEGLRRKGNADRGIRELKEAADNIIVIENEKLLAVVDKATPVNKAFAVADEVLQQATRGIAELITVPGLINCDFADVRTVMLEKGGTLMCTGVASGENRAELAAQQALSSPLLDKVSITGAKAALVNIAGGEDLTLFEVNSVMSVIYQATGSEANLIVGTVVDQTLKDQVRVTVIATGFGGEVQEALPAEEKETVVSSQPAKVMSLFPEASTFPMRKAAGGNGGNGRGKMPSFQEIDRQIPAYIRKIDE